MPKIVALTQVLEDPTTLSQTTHHVLAVYQVDLEVKTTQATLASYARAGAQRPVSHISVRLAELPPAGVDIEQWLYGLIPAGTSDENVLRGSTPVLAAAEEA